jgi:serine/threonine protein kinase
MRALTREGRDPDLDETLMTGTVPYMAPEILSRQPYGYPVDVYAYAVLLNEMVRGFRSVSTRVSTRSFERNVCC